MHGTVARPALWNGQGEDPLVDEHVPRRFRVHLVVAFLGGSVDVEHLIERWAGRRGGLGRVWVEIGIFEATKEAVRGEGRIVDISETEVGSAGFEESRLG